MHVIPQGCLILKLDWSQLQIFPFLYTREHFQSLRIENKFCGTVFCGIVSTWSVCTEARSVQHSNLCLINVFLG